MKRSEINRIMVDAKGLMEKHRFYLPAWADWHLSDWKENKEKVSQVMDNMLGWDITDFGSGDFDKRGLFLFTLRNGRLNVDKKTYAEKIMIVKECQETPMHYHWSKMEDIINRGGGNLVIELYNSTPTDGLSDSPVTFRIDGVQHTIPAGGKVILAPGESICIEQKIYHRFYGEPGKGTVLVGEVSMVNDDNQDNRFYESVGRFPLIDEDAEPLHLLVSDYDNLVRK